MRRIVKTVAGVKDETGAYVKVSPDVLVKPDPVVDDGDISIDSLLRRGLANIDRIMRATMEDASTGIPSRESVQNLKDCMTMLHTLKQEERELLESMSTEALQKIVDDNS